MGMSLPDPDREFELCETVTFKEGHHFNRLEGPYKICAYAKIEGKYYCELEHCKVTKRYNFVKYSDLRRYNGNI